MSITVVSAKKVYASIEDLPEVMGIGDGDRFIIETADGAALLDYENIRIDLDHTTFGSLVTDMQEFQSLAQTLMTTLTSEVTAAQEDISLLRTDTDTLQQQVASIKMLLQLIMGIHAGDSEEAITLDTNTLETEGQNFVNQVYGEVMDKDYQFSLTTHNLRSLASVIDDTESNSISSQVEELKDASTSQDKLIADILTTMSTLIPIGTIVPYVSPEPPEGWLVCNGQEINQKIYPVLYDILSQNSNFKDASTGAVHVPDLRGRFVRGRGDDRTIGSIQGCGVPNITGWFDGNTDDDGIGGPRGSKKGGAFVTDYSTSFTGANGEKGNSGYILFDASRISGVYQNGLTEVRPNNLALNYIIRAANY